MAPSEAQTARRFVSGDFYYAREHLWGFPEAMQIYALRWISFCPKT
jgi:hypothetical protein